MSFTLRTALALAAALAVFACTQEYENIPPNYIAMKLTPSGYEDTIYTPGQVDIGVTGAAGQANQLVLIQSSGLEVKEQFLERDPGKPQDPSDHRCMTADQNPMTLDVRLILGLPNWQTPDGKKDMKRLFTLANPVPWQGSGRILQISAESVYNQLAQLQVRGYIRRICASYKNFTEAFTAFSAEKGGITDRISESVATVLVDQGVPLRLIGVQVSNMKPDDRVIQAQLAQKDAEARVNAIQTLTDFINADPTGTRRFVYKMQVLEEITKSANANGHNTIFLTDLNETGPRVLRLPSR